MFISIEKKKKILINFFNWNRNSTNSDIMGNDYVRHYAEQNL